MSHQQKTSRTRQRGTETANIRDALANATLVIPSARERNHTAETAPEWLDTVVRTDSGRSRARNAGIAKADGEWIILCDDDITFPTELTARLVDGMHHNHLVGLEDTWPMEWLITRYMVFHRSLWERVGGFDESREHGEDTDFCVRAEREGARICRLPRQIVPHHDTDTEFDTAGHAEWLSYLVRRHPREMAPKAASLVARKAGLATPPPDYGDEDGGER